MESPSRFLFDIALTPLQPSTESLFRSMRAFEPSMANRILAVCDVVRWLTSLYDLCHTQD